MLGTHDLINCARKNANIIREYALLLQIIQGLVTAPILLFNAGAVARENGVFCVSTNSYPPHKNLAQKVLLPDINQDKQNNPDDINKVPENRGGIYTKMTCVVVTRYKRATQNNHLQQNASENVQTVEAR